MRPPGRLILLLACSWLGVTVATNDNNTINRPALVTKYNPIRTSSSTTTPIQVGNGNFAFGTDITSLQTFQPFNTLSSWGWKNDSLPLGKTQDDVNNYKGISWLNHGRPVQYDFGGNDPEIEQWLIANPNRVNLGRVGLVFSDQGMAMNVTEGELTNATQMLDLWSGVITSTFSFQNNPIKVQVASADSSDTIAVQLSSPLINGDDSRLGIFLDFPWCDGSSKFSAPFVGRYDIPSNHTTTLQTTSPTRAIVQHDLNSATFVTTIAGDSFTITREDPIAHRYLVTPRPGTPKGEFSLTVTFGTSEGNDTPSVNEIFEESERVWEDYWSTNGFVDVLTGSTDSRADELQRRIILSRYLMRVNEAGDTPPQESGLVNNGWVRSLSYSLRIMNR
jgi:hypothetical protein